MRASEDILQATGPRPHLSFRMRLSGSDNPDAVRDVLSLTPLEGFLLHVVVAGETIYMPVPSISLDSPCNMVDRRRGTVYYNTTSQSICFCCGAVTESTKVNQIAQVLDEDMPRLERLGRLVYEQTVSNKLPTIVTVTLHKPGDSATGPPTPHRTTAKALIDQSSARLRQPAEPDEIQAIRLGATETRAGSERSVFQNAVFLQGFLSTLGPHVFARLLAVSRDGDMTLPLMVRQTREFLVRTFDHFRFLGDLGLRSAAPTGRLYDAALDSLRSLDEYRALTDSLRTLVQLLYRWLHLVFPWYLKDQFQGRTPEEVAGLPKLEKYAGEQS